MIDAGGGEVIQSRFTHLPIAKILTQHLYGFGSFQIAKLNGRFVQQDKPRAGRDDRGTGGRWQQGTYLCGIFGIVEDQQGCFLPQHILIYVSNRRFIVGQLRLWVQPPNHKFHGRSWGQGHIGYPVERHKDLCPWVGVRQGIGGMDRKLRFSNPANSFERTDRRCSRFGF